MSNDRIIRNPAPVIPGIATASRSPPATCCSSPVPSASRRTARFPRTSLAPSS